MTTLESEQICHRMAAIRRDMHDEVDGIVENAKELVDWKYYVRQWPWAAVASAAAVGYLMVPRKIEVMRPDAATLAKLAKDNRVVVESQPQTAAKSSSLVSTILSLAANTALRAGVAYAGQQLESAFGTAAAEPADPGAARRKKS